MKVMQKKRGENWKTVEATKSMKDSQVEKVVQSWNDRFDGGYRTKEVDA